VDNPSAVRRATYARVRGSLRIRTIEIVHRALLAVRWPPRLRRCRVVFPEDASNGLAPHNAANAASLHSPGSSSVLQADAAYWLVLGAAVYRPEIAAERIEPRIVRA